MIMIMTNKEVGHVNNAIYDHALSKRLPIDLRIQPNKQRKFHVKYTGYITD